MKHKTLFILLCLIAQFSFAQIDSLPSTIDLTYILVKPTESELRNFIVHNKMPDTSAAERIVHRANTYPYRQNLDLEPATYFLFTIELNAMYLSLWNNANHGIIMHRQADYVYINVTDNQGLEQTNAKVTLHKKEQSVPYNAELKAFVFKCKKYELPIIEIENNNVKSFYKMNGSTNTLDKRWMKKARKKKIHKFEGYAMLSQAKYKPTDSLRFSSKIVEKGKSCTRPMKFRMIQTSPVYVQFDTLLKPNNHGMYSIEMPIPDSFKLDQQILVVYIVESKKDKHIGNLYYTIEEYELDETDFNANLQMQGDSLFAIIKAVDNNGFPKYGSRVDIEISPSYVTEIAGESLYLDDIVWETDTTINSSFTKVHIPDSIAHLYRGNLFASFTLITPNNERFVTTSEIGIDKKLITIKITTDSLLKIRAFDGKEEVQIPAILHFKYGNKVGEQKIQLPFEAAYDPNTNYYGLVAVSRYIDIQSPDKVSSSAHRVADSAFLSISNPRKLNINYKLYHSKELIEEGNFTKPSKSWKKVDQGKSSYYLVYWYNWQAKVIEKNIAVHPNEKSLHMSIEQKANIFPGEETEINLTFKDHRGNPLPNVAVTSSSVSNQFNQGVDFDLSDFNPIYYSPYAYNNKNINELNLSRSVKLENPWLRSFDLEQSILHQLHEPGSKLLTAYFPVKKDHLNSNLQHYGFFNPFIFNDHQWANIVYIYINDELVYDRSIKPLKTIIVKEGIYNITVRTQKHEFYLDSIEIKAQHKLIVSFDETLVQGIRNKKLSKKLKIKTMKEHARHVAMVYNLSSEMLLVESPGDETEAIGYAGYRVIPATIGPYKNGDVLYFKLKDKWFIQSYKENSCYVVTNDQVAVMEMNVFTAKKQFKLDKYGWTQNPSALVASVEDLKLKKEYIHDYTNQLTKNTYSVQFIGEEISNFIIQKSDGSPVLYVSYSRSSSIHSLEAGSYRVYYFKNDSTYESNEFEVKAVRHNYFQLEFKSTAEPNLFDTLLQEFTYEARLERSLKGKSGVLLQLENLSGDPLASITIKCEISHADSSSESTQKTSDNKGNVFIELKPGDKLKIVTEIRDCRRLGDEGFSYDYNQKTGVVRQSYTVNCPYYARSFEGIHDILILDWTSKRNRRTLDSKDVLAKNRFNWSFNLNSYRKYKALQCPSDLGYGNVNSKQVYGFLSYSDGDGVSDAYENSNGAYYHDMNADAYNWSYGDDVAISEIRIQDSRRRDNYDDRNSYKPYLGTDLNVELDSVILNIGNNPIRKNFADMAYWNPFVMTDNNGKASFRVRYPEDLTKWKETFIAMDNEYRTGAFISYVNSYLPISAQLSTSRFLVEGDESELKTSLINKLDDSISVKTEVLMNGISLNSNTVILNKSHFENIGFNLKDFQTDTVAKVQFQFSMKAENGFKDGELREVDVYPMGIERAEGSFIRIDQSSYNKQIVVKENEEVFYSFHSNTSEHLVNSLKSVIYYKWDCNEQMASKLRASLILLSLNLEDAERKAILKNIKNWIEKLEDNQLPGGGWSWWARGPDNVWMTCYVLEALYKAKQTVELPINGIGRAQLYLIRQCGHNQNKELILNTLMNTKTEYAYEDQLLSIDNQLDKLLYGYRIKMINKQPINNIDLEPLLALGRRSLLGNLYWGIDSLHFGSKHIQQTATALEILRYAKAEKLVSEAEAYLLEIGSFGRLPNTYEATWIAEAIFPHLKDRSIEQASGISIISPNGQSTSRKGKLSEGTYDIRIENHGISYFSLYSKMRDKDPTSKNDLFEVKTSMLSNSKSVDSLKTAEPVILRVEINVKQQSSYVAIEIPIPAGCSYDESSSSYSYESHREKFKHMTRIYVEDLSAGTHVYYVPLLPRYSGSYTLNPVQISQMYFPTLSGNNTLKKAVITN